MPMKNAAECRADGGMHDKTAQVIKVSKATKKYSAVIDSELKLVNHVYRILDGNYS